MADLLDERVLHLCQSVLVKNPPWVSAAYEDVRAFTALVISQISPGERVLDLGTGTGILAICLAKMGVPVVATDISAAAVRSARQNAARNVTQFECYCSDLLESVQGRFDLIAFNPPFNICRDMFLSNVLKSVLRRVPLVRCTCRRAMPTAVVRFRTALIQRLLQQAPEHLNPGGRILLHAFEFDMEALTGILPTGAGVQILRHPLLDQNRSVGMLIQLDGPECSTRTLIHGSATHP